MYSHGKGATRTWSRPVGQSKPGTGCQVRTGWNRDHGSGCSSLFHGSQGGGGLWNHGLWICQEQSCDCLLSSMEGGGFGEKKCRGGSISPALSQRWAPGIDGCRPEYASRHPTPKKRITRCLVVVGCDPVWESIKHRGTAFFPGMECTGSHGMS